LEQRAHDEAQRADQLRPAGVAIRQNGQKNALAERDAGERDCHRQQHHETEQHVREFVRVPDRTQRDRHRVRHDPRAQQDQDRHPQACSRGRIALDQCVIGVAGTQEFPVDGPDAVDHREEPRQIGKEQLGGIGEPGKQRPRRPGNEEYRGQMECSPQEARQDVDGSRGVGAWLLFVGFLRQSGLRRHLHLLRAAPEVAPQKNHEQDHRQRRTRPTQQTGLVRRILEVGRGRPPDLGCPGGKVAEVANRVTRARPGDRGVARQHQVHALVQIERFPQLFQLALEGRAQIPEPIHSVPKLVVDFRVERHSLLADGVEDRFVNLVPVRKASGVALPVRGHDRVVLLLPARHLRGQIGPRALCGLDAAIDRLQPRLQLGAALHETRDFAAHLSAVRVAFAAFVARLVFLVIGPRRVERFLRRVDLRLHIGELLPGRGDATLQQREFRPLGGGGVFRIAALRE